ncbi:hypothetical protein T12_2954 [Trichinella patagoniensis]|uniref:Uncharacterized protein n=1 Tax=Trichinella patagoniensis TaxID=990121 RepID=A0A0V0ZH32_9BILA|nr:hypothetical protein T12_2954 [Trichinella patagoniensis]
MHIYDKSFKFIFTPSLQSGAYDQPGAANIKPTAHFDKKRPKVDHGSSLYGKSFTDRSQRIVIDGTLSCEPAVVLYPPSLMSIDTSKSLTDWLGLVEDVPNCI